MKTFKCPHRVNKSTKTSSDNYGHSFSTVETSVDKISRLYKGVSTRLRTIIFSGFQGTTDSIFFIAGPGSKIDQDANKLI